MDERQPDVRASDRERREVDALLRAALDEGALTLTEYDERAARCWGARTRAELAALTADLPQPAPAPVAVPSASGSGVARRTGRGLLAVIVAGGALFAGYQVVGAPDGASVFGNRVMQIGDGQDRVETGVLFGRTEIVVPDDVRVRTAGTLVFGRMDCELACEGGPGLREVVVDADGAFGSVEIVRPGERDPGDDG